MFVSEWDEMRAVGMMKEKMFGNFKKRVSASKDKIPEKLKVSLLSLGSGELTEPWIDYLFEII